MQHVTRVAELGSSLLEIINGLETMHAALHRDDSQFDAPGYGFLGIEQSEFLAEASRLLHPNHDITLLSSADALYREFPDRCGGVIYDRVVSSFAFQDVGALVKFLTCFDAGILNLLTSREDTFVSSFFGAECSYFSLAELDRLLPGEIFHLFGFQAPKHAKLRATGHRVIEGFFFFGNAARLQAFTEKCRGIAPIREFFVEKQINPKPLSAYFVNPISGGDLAMQLDVYGSQVRRQNASIPGRSGARRPLITLS
jgi:hypothetical protein